MPYTYQIHKPESTYFITLTTVEWADAFMRRKHKQLEAGLVARPEEYIFSSAQDYSGQKGPVKVSLINLHNLF